MNLPATPYPFYGTAFVNNVQDGNGQPLFDESSYDVSVLRVGPNTPTWASGGAALVLPPPPPPLLAAEAALQADVEGEWQLAHEVATALARGRLATPPLGVYGVGAPERPGYLGSAPRIPPFANPASWQQTALNLLNGAGSAAYPLAPANAPSLVASRGGGSVGPLSPQEALVSQIALGQTPSRGAPPPPLVSRPPMNAFNMRDLLRSIQIQGGPSGALLEPEAEPASVAAARFDAAQESDRLAQALAELALEPERDQYPIDIVLVPGASMTLRDAALRRLERFLPPPALLPDQQFDPHYMQLLGAHAVRSGESSPYGVGGADAAFVAAGVARRALPHYAIVADERAFQVVDIRRAISSGTAQGTVYDVGIDLVSPDLQRASGEALNDIDAQTTPPVQSMRGPLQQTHRETHVALVRQGLNGPVTQVHAALKKSPIFQPGLWLAYHAYRRIIAARRDEERLYGRGDPGTPLGALADARGRRGVQVTVERWYSWLGQVNRLLAQNHTLPLGERLLTDSVAQLAADVAEIERGFEAEYGDVNNDAYVDAAGAFLGSQISVSGISPFFPFLYATLRASDTDYFDETAEALLGANVNANFPVQATILQYIDGTLQGLVDSGFFRNPAGTAIAFDRCASVAAQTTFGLAAGQAVFRIVHNDFHYNNLAYENVPYDTIIYFMLEPDVPGGPVIYYAVPTFGKLLKMIDFGRATFSVDLGADASSADRVESTIGATAQQRGGGAQQQPAAHVVWGSNTQQSVVASGQPARVPLWNLQGLNNDLLRFVTVFLQVMNIGPQLPTGPGVDKSQNAFLNFAAHVMTCDGTPGTPDVFPENPSGPLVWSRACAARRAADMRRCQNDTVSVLPFLQGSPCVNAVPIDNVRFFDPLYRIDKSDIPTNAHIYLIPRLRSAA